MDLSPGLVETTRRSYSGAAVELSQTSIASRRCSRRRGLIGAKSPSSRGGASLHAGQVTIRALARHGAALPDITLKQCSIIFESPFL
jgi:hypothetical protein